MKNKSGIDRLINRLANDDRVYFFYKNYCMRFSDSRKFLMSLKRGIRDSADRGISISHTKLTYGCDAMIHRQNVKVIKNREDSNNVRPPDCVHESDAYDEMIRVASYVSNLRLSRDGSLYWPSIKFGGYYYLFESPDVLHKISQLNHSNTMPPSNEEFGEELENKSRMSFSGYELGL
tara:strand:+ start:315 stop:845 length:531 start_codon:yes stop_codon:yes gene_type:complete